MPLNIYDDDDKLVPSTSLLTKILDGSTWISLTYGGVATPFQWSDGRNDFFPNPLNGKPWSSTSDMNKWGYGTECKIGTAVKFDHVMINKPQSALIPPIWNMVRECDFVKYYCICQLPC